MKTKIFKQKLLAVGTAAALGLGFSSGAYADAEAYGLSVLEITGFTTTAIPADGGPLVVGDIINGPGSQTSTSACSSTETPADGSVDAFGFPAPPPFPAGANADVANCTNAGAGSTRAEDVYNPNLGKLGLDNDYSNGDAAVILTDIITTGGAFSTVGEAYTTVASELDPLVNYSGSGLNVLNTSFTLNRAVSFTYSLQASLEAVAELTELSGDDTVVLPSAVNTTVNFQISITAADGTIVYASSDPAIAGGFHEIDNLVVEASPDGPMDTVVFNGPLQETTPVLAPGEYELEISMNTSASVALQTESETPPSDDHFLCYKSFGHFLREEVNLLDQFDETDAGINFNVIKPKTFCNPAIKPELDPGKGIENIDAHLLSYKINEAHREPRHVRQTVLMTDQFFTNLPVETLNPDRLMVPSGKSLDPAVDPVDQTGVINHFKCYRLRPITGFEPISVNVADQFTDPDLDLTDPLADDVAPEGKDLVLLRPSRMCTPVSKNGEPIIVDPDANPNDPRDHLMCYSVKAEAGVRLNRRTEVRSNNQFGAEDLVLKRELEFCAPATKTLLIDGMPTP